MYIQLGESPVSPEISAFAACMEAKLRLEGGTLPYLPTETLLRHMEAKLLSLRVNPGSYKEAFTKAVILGLYAMMIADTLSQEQEAGSLAAIVQHPSQHPMPAVM